MVINQTEANVQLQVLIQTEDRLILTFYDFMHPPYFNTFRQHCKVITWLSMCTCTMRTYFLYAQKYTITRYPYRSQRWGLNGKIWRRSVGDKSSFQPLRSGRRIWEWESEHVYPELFPFFYIHIVIIVILYTLTPSDSSGRRFQNLVGKDRNRRPFEKRCFAYPTVKIWGASAPSDPAGSAGSENWGLTRQVITAPGYKIGSMSGLCPHFEFVCLVVHSQLKPSKCPSMVPSQQSPPRKLPISMSYVVSLILHLLLVIAARNLIAQRLVGPL